MSIKKFDIKQLGSLLKDLSWYRVMIPALSGISPAYSWSLAASISKLCAPKYLPLDIITENLSGKPFDRDLVLYEMYKQWAVSSVVNFSLLKWNKNFCDDYIEIKGLKEYINTTTDGPVFFLSGHCFFMFAITVFLGISGHAIHPIALEPGLTVPPHLSFMSQRIFSESQLNGGSYIFTNLENTFNKNMFKLMLKKTILAAVDFPKNNFRGEWTNVRFMEGCIEIPTRLFKFIIKHRIPSFFVHMRWDKPSNKLILDIEKLDIETVNTTYEACGLFAHALEKRVAACPGSWEGWRWPKVFNHVLANKAEGKRDESP